MATKRGKNRGQLQHEATQQGLYDYKRTVLQDTESKRLAEEATERLKKLYFANPEPLDEIASYYLKIFLKRIKNGEKIILSTYAGYAQTKMAYPEFEFDERMFQTAAERKAIEKERAYLGDNILKDFQINMLMEQGNTIVSRKYSPEKIKKEAKRRVNLTVEVSSFRITPDNFFWLVETQEVFRIMESRRTIFE